MQKHLVTVDPDGRVKIPGTSAGQTITIFVEPEPESTQPGLNTRSLEEWERIKQEILDEGRRNRAEATPEEIERAVITGTGSTVEMACLGDH